MKDLRAALIVALILGVSLLWGKDAESVNPFPGDSTVPGEVIFRFEPADASLPRPLVSQLTSRLEFFRSMESIRYNRYLETWEVHVPEAEDVTSVIASLEADPGIQFAQPSYRYTSADAPDDPLYRLRQHPYYIAINAPAGWQTSSGGPDVVVAVIDGGVDLDHPELAGRIWTKVGDPEDGLDNDGNGCIDDAHGCNFQSLVPDGNVWDFDGHGTFAAGIIGARRNNGEGVAGVAETAVIMPVKALDTEGFGTSQQLAASILYAARSGAQVINLSLTLLPKAGTCPADPLVEDALREAHDLHGATTVAAAGNFNLPCVGFPGSSSYTIAVSASGPPEEPDVRAFFSQWGPQVDVAAPGIDIASTCPVPTFVATSFCPGGAYGSGSGTSFSAPVVSGLAALLIAGNPNIANEEVRERLRSTALSLPDEHTPNWDGAGRIDMAAALGGGSGYAVIDLQTPDASALNLEVVVGDAANPLCRAALWNRPEVKSPGIHGTFGAGECSDHWPPAESRPWSLHGSSAGRKSSRLNGWSLRMGDASCTGAGAAPIPRDPAVIGTITCSGSGIIVNDTPAGAVDVGHDALPAAFVQEVRFATSAGDPSPSCASAVSRGVWYRVTSGAGTAIAVDTFGSDFNTVLALYSDEFNELACNADFLSPQSRIVWQATDASRYYVLAAAYQSVPAGNLKVHFSRADIPANDSREGALAVSPEDPYPVVQPAHSATSATDDPAFSCVPFYGYSLWFSLSAAGGERLTVSTGGSAYDTVMAVFRDDGSGGLSVVACNDDEAPGVTSSKVEWDAAAGPYIIVVGAYPGFAGSTLTLRVGGN